MDMKLMAIDLDGTLLNCKNTISKINADAIRYAQSQGIEIVISTGRSFFDAKSICNKANISTYIIGNNGSSIHNRKAEQLYLKSLNKNEVEKIITWLENESFYYEVSTNHKIYSPIHTREILNVELERSINTNSNIDTGKFYQAVEKQFSQAGFTFVNHYNEIIEKDEDLLNILAFTFNENKRKMGFDYFSSIDTLSTFSSADYNFEIVNRKASKGNALQKLAQLLNISLKETMAVGDSYNDISMFKKAGYSIAMGNAKEDIKALCDFTTKTNDEDGVAHIIYSLSA